MKKIVVACLLLAVAGSIMSFNFHTSANESMVLIPAGEFTYGLTAKQVRSLTEKYGAEGIAAYFLKSRVVKLNAFYIDKYEVTNRQFNEFLVATKRRKLNTPLSRLDCPVTNIGWADARAYAAWAGKRMPTEEEWEKAARGTKGNLYPWGNKDNEANYNGVKKGNEISVKVGSYQAGKSPYGVMDMAGNVYEMTAGKWQKGNCMRGGSFLNEGPYVMTAFRWSPQDTVHGASWLGFRCVKDAK